MGTTSWVFPPAETADEHGIVGVGADLDTETLLHAYSRGLFPMPLHAGGPIAWWSPDPRAIIPIGGLHVSRSLMKSMRRFHFTINSDFEGVLRACGDPDREHGWIDDQMRVAYLRLHEQGWAHSVETRNPDGALIGGIYGVGLGKFFAGESMFHFETDASKAALYVLHDCLRAAGVKLFDVQWLTPHLASLGARELSRTEYLESLSEAVDSSGPDWRITLTSPAPQSDRH